ncbi:MAG: hypothetical protein AB7T06_10815 [Kofleriaceae bacterium]
MKRGPFNGVKVFSATMHAQREAIGDVITNWIETHPHCALREMIVSQSSDASFHCYSFTLLYWEDSAPSAQGRKRSQ